jgi:hypothetical protein
MFILSRRLGLLRFLADERILAPDTDYLAVLKKLLDEDIVRAGVGDKIACYYCKLFYYFVKIEFTYDPYLLLNLREAKVIWTILALSMTGVPATLLSFLTFSGLLLSLTLYEELTLLKTL